MLRFNASEIHFAGAFSKLAKSESPLRMFRKTLTNLIKRHIRIPEEKSPRSPLFRHLQEIFRQQHKKEKKRENILIMNFLKAE